MLQKAAYCVRLVKVLKLGQPKGLPFVEGITPRLVRQASQSRFGKQADCQRLSPANAAKRLLANLD